MRHGGNTPWECLRKCEDPGPCDLIFTVTRCQKVTNQCHSCVQDTAQTSLSDIDEISWDYALVVSSELIRFGVCDLISKFTRDK